MYSTFVVRLDNDHSLKVSAKSEDTNLYTLYGFGHQLRVTLQLQHIVVDQNPYSSSHYGKHKVSD